MPRYVAFLRAINVGGHTVKMAKLRQLFEGLGFDNVETFIASGNVIFETNRRSVPRLEHTIGDHLVTALGFPVATFVRTDHEVAAIAKYKPFGEVKLKSAKGFNVAFLARPPTPPAARCLRKFKTDIDDFKIRGREIYWLCQQKLSESTFSYASLEKALGVQATFRGVNTIRRLTEKLAVVLATAVIHAVPPT